MQLSRLLEMNELHLTLISGDDLSRRIRWVYTTDLPEPARYMSGDELVLTSLTWYRQSQDAWTFVQSLTHGGASGLIAGLAEVGHLPDALADACLKHDLALFTVPTTMSFNVLTEVVSRALLEQRQQLAATVRPTDSLDVLPETLIDTLIATTDLPCTWLSPAGNIRHHNGGQALTDTERATVWQAGRSARGLPAATDNTERPLTVWPVPDSAHLTSYLVMPGHRRDWNVRTRNLVEVTVDRLSTNASRTTPRPSDPEPAHDADGVTTHICAGLDGDTHLCRRILTEMPGGPWETSLGTDGTVTGVRPGTPTRDQFNQIRDQLDWYRKALLPDERLTLGLHQGTSSGDLITAATLHRWATHTTEPVALVSDDDVGQRTLLWRLLPPDAVTAFANQLLHNIHRHDIEHGGDLIDTLRSYVAHGGSWSRAAEELHIHVNSVRYRLHQAEQLAGRTLTRDTDRTDLRIAFEGADLNRFS